MAEKEIKLEQTKGKFKLQGIVTGVERDGAYREGTTGGGKDYKSIRFGVKTSPTNTVYVELFGMEKDQVFAWNTKAKAGSQFDWDDRYDLPKGYHLMGVNVKLTEDGEQETLAELEAVEKIYEELQDDMSVYVTGQPQFSEYEKDGKTVQKVVWSIGSIGLTKNPIDFTDEKFKEVSEFQQTVVITDTDVDRETKKLIVNTYIVTDKKGNFTSSQFVVDGTTHATLAGNMKKRLKFGDLVTVEGKVVNEKITTEVVEEDDWGGDSSSFNTQTATVTEMKITTITPGTHEAKKYTEDDFVKDEAEEDFGGDSSSFDVDDEDLPF